MLKSEYDANGGWPTSSDVIPTSSFCKASFSGVPGASQYNLQPGIPVEVEIGDVIFDQVGASSTCAETPLECGEAYVFRAFAHNVPGGAAKSDWSSTITCNTASCGGGDGGCTYTQGYWKTHGPIPTGQNEYVWPDEVKLNGLMLGNVTYSADDLLTILKTPAAGNGLLSMAHQLIAAKLNVANGAEPTDIASTIANADLLIGDSDILNGGFLSPAVTSSLNDMLADFNEGRPDVGPGHCD